MLREDVDCGRVVSAVRQVQGAELGHQVHETAAHALLVLGEPTDTNTPATMLSLLICTPQLRHLRYLPRNHPGFTHRDVPMSPHNCGTEQNTHNCHLRRRREEVLGWDRVAVVQTVSITTRYQPGTRCDTACPVPPAEPQMGCCSPLRLVRMREALGATEGWSHCLGCS